MEYNTAVQLFGSKFGAGRFSWFLLSNRKQLKANLKLVLVVEYVKVQKPANVA